MDIELRLEFELIVLCARTKLELAHKSRITALLDRLLNWEEVIRLANGHGVLPLISWWLTQAFSEKIPASMRTELKSRFLKNSQRNLLLTGELIRLLRQFESENIPNLAYKGPVLASSIYENPNLRLIRDLDILVPKQYLQQAKNVLLSYGYRPYASFSKPREKIHLETWYEYGFIHPIRRLFIDLHWEIDRFFPMSKMASVWWQNPYRIMIQEKEVRTFSPEILLLVLCLHGAKDTWDRLSLICDISELLRKEQQINWDRVIQYAEQGRVKRQLWVGLFLAHSILGANIPKELIRQIGQEDAVTQLTHEALNRLFSHSDAFLNSWEKRLFLIRTAEYWRDKLRIIWNLFFVLSEAEFRSTRFPSYLSFLYFMAKPFSILGDYLFLPLVRTFFRCQNRRAVQNS
jgi:hypothetical protein